MSDGKADILLQEDILRTLTDNLPDMLWIKDLQGRYLFANKALCENLLMAKDTQEPIGKTDLFFAQRERESHPNDPEWHTFGELCQDSDKITAEAGKPMRFKEWGNVRGKLLYLEVHKAPFYDMDGKMLGVLGSGRDITEQVLMKQELEAQKMEFEYQSRHDPLTGLPNRKFFQERLQQSLKLRRRSGDQLALFFIDLDRFKDINDVYGHDAGDRVLQLVADRLGKCVRETDTLSRLGGDEFTLVVEGFRHPRDLEVLADKVLQALREPLLVDGVTHHLSASIGIAITADQKETVESLLKHADAAMYRAKDKGKDRYEFYTEELTEKALRRMMLEKELRLALEHGQFEVYMQPQVALTDGRIRGVEALIRWNHPTEGLLTPGVFIDTAESIGLLVEMDRWVCKTSLQCVHRWRELGLIDGDFTLSLNLSPLHLEREDFTSHVRSVLQAHAGLVESLELEMTETQLLSNLRHTRLQLQFLKEMGMQLAIDDFGTGYSSFAYLRKLHFDTLKVDRSFVQDIPHLPEGSAIVRAILKMAEALGMRVIAEGVETQAQYEFLRREGCGFAQGYLFAPPMPIEEMEQTLRSAKAGQPLTPLFTELVD